jgi:hypothetical protein
MGLSRIRRRLIIQGVRSHHRMLFRKVNRGALNLLDRKCRRMGCIGESNYRITHSSFVDKRSRL